MGKGNRVPSKRSIQKESISANPVIPGPEDEGLGYKENKRRAIIAGLRMMRAPAAIWLKTGSSFDDECTPKHE